MTTQSDSLARAIRKLGEELTKAGITPGPKPRQLTGSDLRRYYELTKPSVPLGAATGKNPSLGVKMAGTSIGGPWWEPLTDEVATGAMETVSNVLRHYGVADGDLGLAAESCVRSTILFLREHATGQT